MKRILSLPSFATALLLAAPAANAQSFAVPEPGTLLLLGIAIVAVVVVWRRSSK
jgi:hypothetical protein